MALTLLILGLCWLALKHQLLGGQHVHLLVQSAAAVILWVPVAVLEVAQLVVQPQVDQHPLLQHLEAVVVPLHTTLPVVPVLSRCPPAPQAFAALLWLYPVGPGSAQSLQSAWSALA